VSVRSNDGKLYSNILTLSVTPPPLPNYNYIGIIGKPFNDTRGAARQEQQRSSYVQRGDLLGTFSGSTVSLRKKSFLIDANL